MKIKEKMKIHRKNEKNDDYVELNLIMTKDEKTLATKTITIKNPPSLHH